MQQSACYVGRAASSHGPLVAAAAAGHDALHAGLSTHLCPLQAGPP